MPYKNKKPLWDGHPSAAHKKNIQINYNSKKGKLQ